MSPRRSKVTAKAYRRKPPGTMNSLEAAYAAHLEKLRKEGEIIWWAYEPIKLRLANKTTYNPDFLVIRSNGDVEVHETKGRWHDDARVKIKVAAEYFWFFRFVAIQQQPKKLGGGWKYEYFGGSNEEE